MKSLKVRGRFFVTQPEPPKVVEPTMGALDHIAGLSQAAAMISSTSGLQNGCNAEPADQIDQNWETVASVGLDRNRLGSRAARRWSGKEGKINEKRKQSVIVSLVGRTSLNNERDAIGIGQHMAFAAFFRTIGGIGSSMGPPKTARMEALSATARDVSSLLALLKAASKWWRMDDHTLA
jgi:hypothetical protein